MEHIGIYEARSNMSDLVQRVQQGEEFTITRRGAEVAILTSVDKQRKQRGIEALAKLRAIFKHAPVTAEEMIAWSKEGRR